MSGRGAYYKAKYGGRGARGGVAGRGARGGYGGSSGFEQRTVDKSRVQSADDLYNLLVRIDNRQFGAYKDLYGKWKLNTKHGDVILAFDHIQSDPFASPTRAHVEILRDHAKFPDWATSNKIRTVAFTDYLTRRFAAVAAELGVDQRIQSANWGGAKGGEISIDCPGQQVLERTSVLVDSDGTLQARFNIGLPAQGRSVLGEWAHDILSRHLPQVTQESLFAAALDLPNLKAHIDSVEDQESLRDLVEANGLVAFIKNGAILPRSSGASDKPMKMDNAVPFQSPASLEVEFTVPHAGTLKGMGIRNGVTTIVGGGFHGKSTVLEALEKGVYNHIPGDGREFVISSRSAVKIRAEDGRGVSNVNISPFITNLPFGRDTSNFSTADASGSTSQAANIVEAVEAGSSLLLVDEDTCATNFMIRDERMMQLVSDDKEPITPFIHKVRAIFDTHNVSTLLVIGGCGDYFQVSDTVIMMDSYKPFDVTEKAHSIAKTHASSNGATSSNQNPVFGTLSLRSPEPSGFVPSGDSQKVIARRLETIQYGGQDLDLTAVEQLVETSQVRSIADIMQWLVHSRVINSSRTMSEILDIVESEIDQKGLDGIAAQEKPGNLSIPRRFEVAAAINRLRSATFKLRSAGDKSSSSSPTPSKKVSAW